MRASLALAVVLAWSGVAHAQICSDGPNGEPGRHCACGADISCSESCEVACGDSGDGGGGGGGGGGGPGDPRAMAVAIGLLGGFVIAPGSIVGLMDRDGDYLDADEARWAWDAYRQERRELDRLGARIERLEEELRDAVKMKPKLPRIVPLWRRKRLVPSIQFECNQVAATGVIFGTGINGVFDDAQGKFAPQSIAEKCKSYAPEPRRALPARNRPDDLQCPGSSFFCPKAAPIFNPLDESCYPSTNFARSERDGWKTTRSIQCQ